MLHPPVEVAGGPKPANAPIEQTPAGSPDVTDGLSNTILVGEKQCHVTVLG